MNSRVGLVGLTSSQHRAEALMGSRCKQLTSLRAVQILCGRGAGVGWLILQHIRKNRVVHPSRLGLPAVYRWLVQGVLVNRRS